MAVPQERLPSEAGVWSAASAQEGAAALVARLRGRSWAGAILSATLALTAAAAAVGLKAVLGH